MNLCFVRGPTRRDLQDDQKKVNVAKQDLKVTVMTVISNNLLAYFLTTIMTVISNNVLAYFLTMFYDIR